MQSIRWLRRMFGAASVGWAAALPGAALSAGQQVTAPLRGAAIAVYAAGAVVCHQRPERSFHLAGVPLPVCARCTGIYVAAAAVAVAAALLTLARRGGPLAGKDADHRRTMAPPDRVRWLAVCAATPTVLTLLWEWTVNAAPSNVVRAAAGIPIGAFVAWLLMHIDDEAARDVGRVRQSE